VSTSVTALKSKAKKSLVLGGLFVAIFSSTVLGNPQAAHASAPVMAMPKAEDRDPVTDAIQAYERRMAVQTQQELNDMAAKCRQIEAEQGEAARIKYEKEFHAEKERQAEQKKIDVAELKLTLVKQGICPFTDLEGSRQVILLEKGIDLGKVDGTPYNLEKYYEKKSPKKSQAYQKAVNRQVLACMATDMINRDVDPVAYFESHKDKISAIQELPPAEANGLLQQYKANIEQYGQITVPKPGEASALEKKKNDPAAKKAAKEEAKRIKAEEKARAREEKERAKEEKAKLKAEEAAAKKEAKRLEAEAKAAAKAESAEPAEAGAEEMAESDGPDATALATTTTTEEGGSSPAASSVSKKGKLPIVKVSTFLVAAGGGGYGVKLLRDKAAQDEEERQRQFKLLMGMDDDED